MTIGVPSIVVNDDEQPVKQIPDIKFVVPEGEDHDDLQGLFRTTNDSEEINDNLLNLFIDDQDQVQVHKLISQVKKNGIRPFADVRLFDLMNRLSIDPNGLFILSEIGVRKLVAVSEFKAAAKAANCCEFLNLVLSSSLTIPDWQSFVSEIKKMYLELKDAKGGKNAQYIPQLARVNPNFWGIAICTIDGQRFSIGDTEVPFCIQSCSKALNYAVNVAEMGPDEVHKYLGKEPSGVGFNQIGLDKNNLPHNPMINPGAISCVSTIKKGHDFSLADKFDHVTNEYKRMAGGEFIGFSNATFLSEKSEADRNYAIGYYLKEHGVFPKNTNLHETLDLYFQLCSVEATADSASVIAATLANGGVCPLTSDQCITADAVRNTLSLMFSCGMYDYSGEWSFEVGLPAKSGVAGSIFIVVPEVMGICVWSPPLDELGNSYKGILFAKKLIEKFSFHQFDCVQGGVQKLDPRRKIRHETKEMQISNMLSAASGNDMVLLTRYFETGVDFNLADYDSRTSLHLSVCSGHLDIVRFLTDKAKVNINCLDRWNSTPLDDAYKYEVHDIIRFLEKRGAKRGETLLLAATVQY